MKKIIIIGGGFGGVYAAKNLIAKLKGRAQITLLSKVNFFTFTPLLHELATGTQTVTDLVVPIRDMLKGDNFDFARCTVLSVNFETRIVHTDCSDYHYDELLIAIGSQPQYHGMPGAHEYCLPLKEVTHSLAIRKKLISAFEDASFVPADEVKNKLTFVVVGGGPTGVELVSEISEFVDQLIKKNYQKLKKELAAIYLIERGDKIMPFIEPKCVDAATKLLIKKGVKILFNTSVEKVTGKGVHISGGRTISTTNVFWTAGVKPHSLKEIPKISNNEGFFEVDKNLQIIGLKNVYAVGDCTLALNPDGSRIPALAQAAVKQARVVSDNIVAKVKGGDQKVFVFKHDGILVSIGRRFGIADVKGIIFKGFFAWWIMHTIYLSKMIGIERKFRVVFNWTIRLFLKRDTSEI